MPGSRPHDSNGFTAAWAIPRRAEKLPKKSSGTSNFSTSARWKRNHSGRTNWLDLARKLGDVLGRVYRGDSFVVERNGDPIARLVPLPGKAPSSLREALAAWHAAGARDLTFADDLERIGAADSPPENPWAS